MSKRTSFGNNLIFIVLFINKHLKKKNIDIKGEKSENPIDREDDLTDNTLGSIADLTDISQHDNSITANLNHIDIDKNHQILTSSKNGEYFSNFI